MSEESLAGTGLNSLPRDSVIMKPSFCEDIVVEIGYFYYNAANIVPEETICKRIVLYISYNNRFLFSAGEHNLQAELLLGEEKCKNIANCCESTVIAASYYY